MIAGDLEFTAARDTDLDLVTLLEVQGFDYRQRKAYRQTVSPFCNLYII